MNGVVPVTAACAPPVASSIEELRTTSNVTTDTAISVQVPLVVIQSALPTAPIVRQAQSSRLTHNCLDMSLWTLMESTDGYRTADPSVDTNYNGDTIPAANVIVDIIIPVHNAATTIHETIASAMNQIWLIDSDVSSSTTTCHSPNIQIHVCCYDDASTDDSWSLLQDLYDSYINTKRQCPSTMTSSSLDSLRTKGDHTNDIDMSSATFYQIPTRLWISSSPPESVARGPGYARNRAVEMRDTIIMSQAVPPSTTTTPAEQHFLCWLDSDDVIHPTRIYYQVHTMMQLIPSIRLKTLLGTNFNRFITTTNTMASDTKSQEETSNTITPHYTKWANELSHERLYLEQFREVTIIQPTWMMCRSRYVNVLHGYLECPVLQQATTTNEGGHDRIETDGTTDIDTSSKDSYPSDQELFSTWLRSLSCDRSACFVDENATPQQLGHDVSNHKPWRLVHPEVETVTTIRVAEDLRFFHEHLFNDGLLRRIVTSESLVSYRHRPGVSQSALTSRKLLLALRVASFERKVFNTPDPIKKINTWNGKFMIWGAGRDGKDFFKALSPEGRQRVYCFLDVDDAKIARGFYNYSNPTRMDRSKKTRQSLNIPIVHFSLAAKDCTIRSRLYDSWKLNSENTNDSSVAPYFGRVTKNQDASRLTEVSKEPTQMPPLKRIKIEKVDPGTKTLDLLLLPTLPVVVCVAMYRTNGALESNVKLINRIEGHDFWYFI